MTLYTSSIPVDSVIDALKDFLTPFMLGGKVVRAQVNRVALPSDPCAVLTELRQQDISVPYTEYQPLDDTATVEGSKRIDIQIDFYGEQAGEFVSVVKLAFRSQWGFNAFPANIKPLYTDDGLQTPLLTGEQQYQSRWTLTAFMQYNPTVTLPQQFADAAAVNLLIPVDVFY